MRTRSSEKLPKARRAPSERRAGPRHPVQVPIEVTTGREMLIHATSNLSGHGAFFQRAIPYAVGTRVHLRILLPGERPIETDGEVVNIPDRTAFGMGVKFLGLSQADSATIEQFAARHGHRSDDDPLA